MAKQSKVGKTPNIIFTGKFVDKKWDKMSDWNSKAAAFKRGRMAKKERFRYAQKLFSGPEFKDRWEWEKDAQVQGKNK